MKTLAGAFNQEKALVEAFSVIVQPVVEPMDRFTALLAGDTAGAPLPPPGPGEEFSAAFGDPDCGGQPIEGKV